MDDDGRQPKAIDHLSDSGDIIHVKRQKGNLSILFCLKLFEKVMCLHYHLQIMKTHCFHLCSMKNLSQLLMCWKIFILSQPWYYGKEMIIWKFVEDFHMSRTILFKFRRIILYVNFFTLYVIQQILVIN